MDPDNEKLVRSKKILSIALLVFATSLFCIAWVIGSLYFKAAVYECHYGVDDSNVFSLEKGYVSKNSQFVNGSWKSLDNIRCERSDNAEDFVCPSKFTYTGEKRYAYATERDYAKAGLV